MIFLYLEIILTLANVGGVERGVVRTEESVSTLVAVDPLGVVATVLANTASLVIPVDVHRQAVDVNFRVVDALVRVSVAVARFFAGKRPNQYT